MRTFGVHWLAFLGALGRGDGDKLKAAIEGHEYPLLELACNPINGMTARETAEAVLAAGIKQVSYCRFYPDDESLGDPLGLGELGDLAITTFEKDVAFIKELRQAGLIVQFITGPSCFVLGKDYSYLDKQTLRQRLIRFVSMQATITEGQNVTVCLEYLRPNEDSAIGGINEMLSLLEAINKPQIGLHADVFHMLQRGETPWVTIRNAGKHLKYLHAHGHNRIAPGMYTGLMDSTDSVNWHLIGRALNEIGYQGPVVPEPFGQAIRDQVSSLGEGLPPAVEAHQYYQDAFAHLQSAGVL